MQSSKKAGNREQAPQGVAERQELLTRLLARLAHEIRNPLGSLDIHLQLLEEDVRQMPTEWRERLTPRFEILQGELHRLARIVENFLRLSRPSALNPEQVMLNQVLAHVCKLLQPEAMARKIEIVTEAPPNLAAVEGDPVRLTQALLNLLINAMQAIGRRGRIQVRVKPDAEGVSLVVQDNGPGIPEEKLSAIFDPYFTTKPEGTGLGLWIAQQIAAAHGGTVRARNARKGGAEFTLRLPWRCPRESTTRSRTAQTSRKGRGHRL